MKEFTPTIEQAKAIAHAYEHCNGDCFLCDAKVRIGSYEKPYELKCGYTYEQARKILERKGETK